MRGWHIDSLPAMMLRYIIVSVLINIGCASDVKSNSQKLETLFRTMNLTTKSNAIFLVEKNSDITYRMPELHLGFESGVTTMYYHQATFDIKMADLVDRAISEASMDLYRVLFNFIVICENDCLSDILSRADVLDDKHGRRGLLRHFSKWLFVVYDVRSGEAQVPQTNIDNVAVAYLQDTYQVDADASNCTSITSLTRGNKSRYWDVIGEYCFHDDTTTLLFGTMFPNAKRGLNGRHLTIGMLEWLPFCEKIPNEEHVQYKLTCRDLFNSLGHYLNYSYRFVEPADRTWGIKTEDNTWTGLLGMAVRDEIDLVGMPYGATMERSAVMSFTNTVIRTAYQVAYRKTTLDDTWSVLVNPFTKDVYLWAFLSLVCIVVFYALLERCYQVQIMTSPMSGRPPLLDIVQTPIIVIFYQGTDVLPKSSSARVLFSFWWVFCIVLVAVYTGNLMAFIAVKKDSVPFMSLAELAANNEYNIIMQTGTFLEDTMKITSDPALKAIYEKILDTRTADMEDSSVEYDRHIELLLSGGHAYIELDLALDSIDTNGTDVSRMMGDILGFSLRLPFPKNSPLLGVFSEMISFLDENGILERWKRVWRPRKTATEGRSGSVQLPLRHLSSALVACACGISLSAFTLGVEYTVQRYISMRRTTGT